MKRNGHAPKQEGRHANARNAATKAIPPQADESYPGEIGPDLECLVIDADEFDADAVALVSDVQRMHFDHEGLVN